LFTFDNDTNNPLTTANLGGNYWSISGGIGPFLEIMERLEKKEGEMYQ